LPIDKETAVEFSKAKLKKKKRVLEKKMVRELTEDTRVIENERLKHQSKVDVVKEKNYKKLKAELERQQVILKKENTANHNFKRKMKKHGTRIGGNKTR